MRSEGHIVIQNKIIDSLLPCNDEEKGKINSETCNIRIEGIRQGSFMGPRQFLAISRIASVDTDIDNDLPDFSKIMINGVSIRNKNEVRALFSVMFYQAQSCLNIMRGIPSISRIDLSGFHGQCMNVLRVLSVNEDEDDENLILNIFPVFKKKKVIGILVNGMGVEVLGLFGEKADSKLCLLTTNNRHKVIKVIEHNVPTRLSDCKKYPKWFKQNNP